MNESLELTSEPDPQMLALSQPDDAARCIIGLDRAKPGADTTVIYVAKNRGGVRGRPRLVCMLDDWTW
jgi:hypothetical protein